ncbi:MAG TPA: RluA family pseudouridine synthase, partial [Verrucomicrobiae bacterium]|nr:RluA family pseudouridine synthase [Verrucomicrobiae bacterium]
MNTGGTLLERLLAQYPDTPRSRAKEWILAGRVSVDDVIIRKPHHVPENSDAVVSLAGRKSSGLDCGAGWRIHARVTLLYLDASIAIVNKGPGIISVPAAKPGISALSVLEDFLCGKLAPANRRIGFKSLPPPFRGLKPLPVHRLDQYTSGVFAIATSASGRAKLIEQLNAHMIEREYVAYVEGRPSARHGTWRNLVRLSHDEMRQEVLAEDAEAADPRALEAVTHYEVLAEFATEDGQQTFSKLRLRLETGRKHQIRAQAAAAGHPLIGDRTYNLQYRSAKLPQEVREFPRQALHAEKLALEHP